MKTTLALLVAGATVAGCAIVPAEPGPAVYAAPMAVVPPPVVVVRPYRYYGGYYGHYGYYGRYGYRRWR